MAKIPVISGEKLIRLLKKARFEVIGQRGSHVSLQKEDYKTVVPLHNELARGTLHGILKQCGFTREDLQRFIEKQ